MEEFATSDEMPMAIAFSSPSAMELWRHIGARTYPARFVAYVNEATAAREAESGGASSDAAAV
jgi:hypothetical protein